MATPPAVVEHHGCTECAAVTCTCNAHVLRLVTCLYHHQGVTPSKGPMGFLKLIATRPCLCCMVTTMLRGPPLNTPALQRGESWPGGAPCSYRPPRSDKECTWQGMRPGLHVLGSQSVCYPRNKSHHPRGGTSQPAAPHLGSSSGHPSLQANVAVRTQMILGYGMAGPHSALQCSLQTGPCGCCLGTSAAGVVCQFCTPLSD